MSTRSNHRSQLMIDLLLIPVSMASAWTGIELHLAGHGAPHAVWEQWALTHVLASILFLVFGFLHVWHHQGWYKSLFRNGLGKKSRVTLALTFIFLLIIVTGIILLVVIDGPNSSTGVFHFLLGIMLTILFVWHILRRWRSLAKMLKGR